MLDEKLAENTHQQSSFEAPSPAGLDRQPGKGRSEPAVADSFLETLLSQVSEEIVIEDDLYEWMDLEEWTRRHGSLNPGDGGWQMEENRLYRPRRRRRN